MGSAAGDGQSRPKGRRRADGEGAGARVGQRRPCASGACCSGDRVRGSGCAAPAQQRGPSSLEQCRVGSAGFLWCLLLFRIPPEGSQGFQNVSCHWQLTQPTFLFLQRAELCPPSVWSWMAGTQVPQLGPWSPTGPRAAGQDPERLVTRLPAALRHSVREEWHSHAPSIQRVSAQELGQVHFLKTHLLEQKPVMLYYFRFTK